MIATSGALTVRDVRPPVSSWASTMRLVERDAPSSAASQHAIGAARRSEAWAATEASFSTASCCSRSAPGCPRAAAKASIHCSADGGTGAHPSGGGQLARAC